MSLLRDLLQLVDRVESNMLINQVLGLPEGAKLLVIEKLREIRKILSADYGVQP